MFYGALTLGITVHNGDGVSVPIFLQYSVVRLNAVDIHCTLKLAISIESYQGSLYLSLDLTSGV
jgi:hypothetical protein